MTKKNKKLICSGICFFSFLFFGFICLSTNKVFATGLEVKYPTLPSGTTLGLNPTLPDYVVYLFDAGMFIGVFAVFISLAIAGAMYFLSPISAEMKSNAKDRVFGAISGLLILTLTYLIITTINPQLSVFNFDKLPPVPPPPKETKASGVYFYKSGCDDSAQPNTSSIPDLGDLKNHVNSVDIVHDTENRISYISILYNNPNFWGMCQYVDPNIGCQSVTPFASSASVYEYNFNPDGDGVYFYRKSYFNEQGGYYKVPNEKINGIYVEELEKLQFQNVPEEEQDCVKYNKDGKCVSRKAPSLAGKNISSVKINGDYLVLFVYFGPKDEENGPWTSCQEFPTVDDVNKIGPQQMKWENIRNSNGVIPNYVVIIPIQR